MKKQGSAAVAAIALLVASCSDSASPSTTAFDPPPTTPATTIASTTTTAVATTTTTTPPTTTRSETVGSPEALAALIDEVVAEVGAENLVDMLMPDLDLSNPDAIAAFQTIVRFEDWALKTAPDPAWAAVVAVDGSEGFRSYRNGFDSVAADGAIWVDRGEPYKVYDFTFIELADIPVPVPSDFDPPTGSVAFVHDSSKGPFDVIRSATGDLIENRPGWQNIEHVVVLSPTDVGWQVYFSEVVR